MPCHTDSAIRSTGRLPRTSTSTSDVVDLKRRMLACHKSQKEWLDQTQGVDSYLDALTDMSEAMGRLSGAFPFAEGWTRHLPLGLGPDAYNPLIDWLGARAPDREQKG